MNWHRQACLEAQKTLQFICAHPEGVTAKDMKAHGIRPAGLERLLRLRLIRGRQIREPERGTRAYHWLWTARKGASGASTVTERRLRSKNKPTPRQRGRRSK